LKCREAVVGSYLFKTGHLNPCQEGHARNALEMSACIRGWAPESTSGVFVTIGDDSQAKESFTPHFLQTNQRGRMERNNQITGNVGMYYACYRLSQLGLNVMPTARNAKGADIIAYTPDQKRFITFQVKAMTKLANISLGKSLDAVSSDWWIVVTNAYSEPISFILTPDEVRQAAKLYDGTYWAQGSQLNRTDTFNAWHRIYNPSLGKESQVSETDAE
jgi:hypothetical protein